MEPYKTRIVPVADSGCSVPLSARAYSLNFTAVPPGPLDWLSAWPAGQAYPGVSTLNSPGGATLANAAIFAAGQNGGIAIVSGQPADLIIDVNGYFAPKPG